MSIVTKILWSFFSLSVITVWGLTMNGIVAKIFARVQGRLGPPVWQPFVDIIKNNAYTRNNENIIHHILKFNII